MLKFLFSCIKFPFIASYKIFLLLTLVGILVVGIIRTAFLMGMAILRGGYFVNAKTIGIIKFIAPNLVTLYDMSIKTFGSQEQKMVRFSTRNLKQLWIYAKTILKDGKIYNAYTSVLLKLKKH